MRDHATDGKEALFPERFAYHLTQTFQYTTYNNTRLVHKRYACIALCVMLIYISACTYVLNICIYLYIYISRVMLMLQIGYAHFKCFARNEFKKIKRHPFARYMFLQKSIQSTTHKGAHGEVTRIGN